MTRGNVVLERVAYSPYGVARHQWPADANGDGAVNSADLSIVLGAFGAITAGNYRSEADFGALHSFLRHPFGTRWNMTGRPHEHR